MNPSSLVVGKTYYQLTFADIDQTMPGVQPMVYLGLIATEEDASEHAFQDTVSYVRFGSALSASEGHGEMEIYCMRSEELGDAMFDLEAISREIAAAAARAVALNNPQLRVLGTKGWR
jgi:hypothetical protein